MQNRRVHDLTSSAALPLGRLRGEGGEGVISTAIAVLIMALIGAAMWVAFDRVFQTASGTIESSVESIQ